MNFALRRLRGLIERLLAPSYGGCHRCGRSWAWATWHETYYTDSSACFPLCQRCWLELTPETRLPYYKELWLQWREAELRNPDHKWLGGMTERRDWEAIRAAVEAGL